MAIDFSKFDKSVDLAGLKSDIKEAEENGGSGNYKEVPVGNYEVKITKLELGESKKHDPMVTVWFKILEGEYKGSLIFMNQVVTQGFQIHIVDDFLKSLETEVEVTFESYAQYAQMLMDIAEEIDGAYEYNLKYGKTDKGFNTFEIVEIYEVE